MSNDTACCSCKSNSTEFHVSDNIEKKKMKLPHNSQNGLKKLRPSKSRRQKLSRESLYKLLKEKIKQEVTKNQEIVELKSEKLQLEKEIKHWKGKSEMLANTCKKLASMVQGHMDLNSELNSSIESENKSVKRKRSISNSRDKNEDCKKQKQEELRKNYNEYFKTEKPNGNDHSTVQKCHNKVVLNGIATSIQTQVKLMPFVSDPPSVASINGVSTEHASKGEGIANQHRYRIPESVHSNTVQQENHDNDLPPLPNQVELSQLCPRPTLKLSKSDKGLEVLWEFEEDDYDEKLIKKYHLYSCNPSSKNGTVSWKKVGIIDSIKLPIKVTLSDFKSGTTYFFSVRGEDHNNGFGRYSKVEQIHL